MADGDISSRGEAASLAGVAVLGSQCRHCGRDWRGDDDGPPDGDCPSDDCPSNVARAAVEEVLGPEGPGPFPPSSGLTRGGRSMPVEHTEDGGR